MKKIFYVLFLSLLFIFIVNDDVFGAEIDIGKLSEKKLKEI